MTQSFIKYPQFFIKIQCVAHKNYAYGHIPNQAIISKVTKQKINICFIDFVLFSY